MTKSVGGLCWAGQVRDKVGCVGLVRYVTKSAVGLCWAGQVRDKVGWWAVLGWPGCRRVYLSRVSSDTARVDQVRHGSSNRVCLVLRE